MNDVFGLFVTPLVAVAVLEERAVRGVGALMRDFLGVSVTALARVLNVDDGGVGFGVLNEGLVLRPPATKGCRKAV